MWRDRQSFSYTSAGLANNNGNVWSQTITNLGATQAYTYDPLNRLSSATETAGSSTTWYQNYGYDNYGNRWVPSSSITLSGLTPTSSAMIDPATNRLIGSNYYLFDLAGNQKFVSPWAMTFDPESRITGFTSANNGSGTYTYDGEGRRVLKTVGGTTTLYVYDAQGNRAAEYASTVAAPPCATCYETVDTLGSLRAVTDGFGNTIALHDYLPFGEELSTANRSGVPGYGISDGLVDRFTGKPRDAETGLDYFGARYMSLAQGRFTSIDPENAGADVETPQSWNAYAYVSNNPMSYVDPFGLNQIYVDGAPNDRPFGMFGVLGGNGMTACPNACSFQTEFGLHQFASYGDGSFGYIEPYVTTATLFDETVVWSGFIFRSWDPSMPFPSDPTGLGPGWTKDPSHQAPNDERFVNDKGDKVDWHAGKPSGGPRWEDKDHWHWIPGGKKDKSHYRPGETVKKAVPAVAVAAALALIVDEIISTAPVWAPIVAIF